MSSITETPSAQQFLAGLQQEIQERMEGLKPAVEEYERLVRADQALTGTTTKPKRGRPRKVEVR